MKTKLDQTSMSWVVDTLNSSNNTKEANRFEEITDSDQLCNTLLDGTLLCILANSIRPNTIKKFNKNKPNREMMKFKRLENIQKFLTACRQHLCLESFSPFTSSDLEVGGFGGNNSSNVIATLKHLMEQSNTLSDRKSRGGSGTSGNKGNTKPSLVTLAGYPDEEECFYMDEYDDVHEVTLFELRELYESKDASERLKATTLVSFGEDWKELTKWLGPRVNTITPAWKKIQKKVYGGGGFLSLGGGGNSSGLSGISKKDNSYKKKNKRTSSSSSINSRPSAAPSVSSVANLNEEKWFFEDDENSTIEIVGPFKLSQMQIWYDMGKIRDDQIVWYEINGVLQTEKMEACQVPILSEEPAPSNDGNEEEEKEEATKASPPPRPAAPFRLATNPTAARPPRPPPSAPNNTRKITLPPQRPSKCNGQGNDSDKEYRRGLLGKFARGGRRKHSVQSRNTFFRKRNWKKRFFCLRGQCLEYWETRTKFIRRKKRNGGIVLEEGDEVERNEGGDQKNTRFGFELLRDNVSLLKMFAEDDVDRKLWIEAIQQCIQEI